jgi:hypothetical protein
MEVVIGIISLFMIVAFFGIGNNLRKLLNTQNAALKAIHEQNNLLSEQITILKGDYKPDNNNHGI